MFVKKFECTTKIRRFFRILSKVFAKFGSNFAKMGFRNIRQNHRNFRSRFDWLIEISQKRSNKNLEPKPETKNT